MSRAGWSPLRPHGALAAPRLTYDETGCPLTAILSPPRCLRSLVPMTTASANVPAPMSVLSTPSLRVLSRDDLLLEEACGVASHVTPRRPKSLVRLDTLA